MNRIFRVVLALFLVGMVSACGGSKPVAHTPSVNKFRSYAGPPVTQIIVKKGDRRMYLVSGKTVLRSYNINLGNQPAGPKRFEGDGRTPEGTYFINRFNPNSRYHLSVGISYPNNQDAEHATLAGVRPGGDIMIHGLGPEGRAINRPDWTAGCIAVSDEEIEDIYAMLRPGVPIFIFP